MPSLSHKIVESADSPASKDDYIRLQGLRLVIDNSTGVPTSVRQVLKSLLVQVKPYYFDFLCSVKRRWLGMTIIDVFSEVCLEFIQHFHACAVWHTTLLQLAAGTSILE